MAATVTVNRPPPAHPGLIGGNVQSRPNGSELNSGLQDPGLQQEPGPSSQPQHHVTARPIFYVPAPPPPPFLQYQWPMPFSYNPFAGVPGMGEYDTKCSQDNISIYTLALKYNMRNFPLPNSWFTN